jgi:chitin synthase
VQALCAWSGYLVAKFACKYGIQPVAFALPLVLATPVTVVGLSAMCAEAARDPCAYRASFPDSLFFRCPTASENLGWIGSEQGWAWLLWLLSQLWIAYHVWVPRSARLAATSQMFSTPFYSSLVLDQSLMLNRRCDDGKRSRRFDFKTKHFGELRKQLVEEKPRMGSGIVRPSKKPKRKISALTPTNDDFDSIELDTTTRIYGCATMWHENSDEIAEMLKSIFRIDEDYSARRIAMKVLDVSDPDYYEWETHIFFDDCMERSAEVKDEFIVNQFVRLLVVSVEEWGRKWYGQRQFTIGPPVVIPTPYGGRLVWRLPGGTQIICHLKDKNKIRHKKRWSQCMYMYYFLGYQATV